MRTSALLFEVKTDIIDARKPNEWKKIKHDLIIQQTTKNYFKFIVSIKNPAVAISTSKRPT